jgi:DNA-binding IclR family transcriptional regulator
MRKRGERDMPTLVASNPSGRRSDESDLSAVKTLRKALAILDAAAAAERPLTVAEVAIRAGVTRPTAHRLIQTMVGEGYLAQDPDDSRVTPGYSVLMLAGSLLDTDQIRLESLPHLDALAHRTGERVSLGILHRHQMLYLAGVEKPSLPTIFSRFGKTMPAYTSAMGKAILAYLPEVELARFLRAAPLDRLTQSTITDETALRAELAEVRREGIALDRGEATPGTCCLGAAIVVHDAPVAGIAVVGRAIEPLMAFKDDVKHTAEVIAHVLGRGA